MEFYLQPAKHQYEALAPILTLFMKLASSNMIFRKFLRKKILPPLRDVHNRPEQGTSLRNYHCKLLTSPITQIRDLVSEFLFTLCKENGKNCNNNYSVTSSRYLVGRMIKYTGYGNAAGMFANRGLLGGQSRSESKYSSDSSDSETEEYNEYKYSINPVVGCYEKPHANPLDGMSQEQVI